MYEVAKTFGFSASHHNPLAPEGNPCRNVHGHNWEVRVVCRGTDLDDAEWLVPFDWIRKVVKPLADGLDHGDLNDLLPINPTCENIARWFHEQIVLTDGPLSLQVHRIDVTERAGDWGTYASYLPPEE